MKLAKKILILLIMLTLLFAPPIYFGHWAHIFWSWMPALFAGMYLDEE